MPSRRPFQSHPAPPAYVAPWLASYRLALAAAGKAQKTTHERCTTVNWATGWIAQHDPAVADFADITVEHLRGFFAAVREQGYSVNYQNNVGRALQAFWKWWSVEEDLPNIFGDRLKPPPPVPLGSTPPPIIATDHLRILVRDAERGRGFQDRRDAALLRFFASTGCRLAEVTNLGLDDLDLAKRRARVTGKRGKSRVVRFDVRCAVALDRYLRARAKHRAVAEFGVTALWLGTRRLYSGMTPSGVRQALTRRAENFGIDLWPHQFRHTFAHNYLDSGGQEGNLMDQTGWESAAMLQVYGRSARSARAHRAYDDVDVMRGV